MAQSSRFAVPPAPRRRGRSPRSSRSPVVGVERLWGRLADLFRPRVTNSLATQAVLAPRRLEPRRMLDAAAAGLMLETLDYSADYVQAGPDAASLALAPTDNGPAAAITTPAGSMEILPPAAIDEDGFATLEFVYDVPGSHTVKIEWGDGEVESFNIAEDSQLFSTTHQYLDDDPTGTTQDLYTVKVSVTGSLGTVEDFTSQTVFNVAPSNIQVDLVSPKFESDVTDLTVTFDDRGTLDTHTVEVNWGDGVIENFQLDGSRFLFTTHQYLDDPPSGTTDGSYTAIVRVIDDDGGEATAAPATITMFNVAPSNVQVSLVSPIFENAFTELTMTFDDPGILDTHVVEVNWGDGVVEMFNLSGERFFSTTHRYLDDPPSGTTDGSYTATVRVIDDDGGEGMGSATITMLNVAPSNVQVSLVSPIFENGFTELTMTFDDPGTLDSHTVEVNWGDGVTEMFNLSGERALFTTHQYLDDPPSGTTDGTYTATVRVIDDDTGEGMGSAAITILNVAPSNVQVSMVSPIFENGFTELTMTFDDPGTLDTHVVEVNWGDGVTEMFNFSGERAFITTHQYLDDPPSGTSDGSYTATVRVIDDDTGEGMGSATVTMLNVAPSNVQVSLVSPIFENGFTELTMTFDDPGTLDTHTVEVNWGDGVIESFNLNGERILVTTHQYLDDPPTGTPDGSYTATVRVIDDDTGEGMGSATITMLNVAPSNVQVSLVSPIFENGVTELTMTFDDPGTLDTHTVEVDWGDGVIETFNLNGERVFSTTHQYLDDPPTGTPDGSYTATVRVIDDDTGEAMGSATVTMLNVAPSNVQVSLVSPIFENDFTELTLTFDDPGTLDTHVVEVNWGDGVIETFNLNGERFLSTTHQYLDDPPSGTPDGTYTVMVTITDDDTGVGQGSGTITILNVAPRDVVVIGPGSSVLEGDLTGISVTFDDPGTLDTHTYVVYWGDGKSSAGSITGHGFDATHIYADNGNYTVLVEVTDDDTGLGTGGTVISVINVAPTPIQPGALATMEGSLFVLDGATRLRFTDPGFDNPLNTQDPTNGGETVETFTYTIDWDDGTAMSSGMAAIDTPGGENVLTQGSISSQHIYADNGEYLVTVTILDDDMGESVLTFIVSVANVAPTLTPPAVQPVFQINEGQTVTIPDFGTFTDPGFNNPLNAGNASNGGEVAETFSYTVDWGDGTIDNFTPTSTNGGENVLTAGALGGASHFYADNPDGGNVYHVLVTLSDDDLGQATRIIDVTVLNVNPTLSPLTATEVTPQGFTTLNLFFTDPGADQYRVLVDWGDNLTVVDPLQRFEIIDIQPTPDGAGGHAYTLIHKYDGPPDPLHPAADIVISVKIWDDEFLADSSNVPAAIQAVVDPGESNVEVVVIGNPGPGNNDAVRIDTTPQVPMLTLSERPADTVVVVDANTGVAVTTAGELGGSGGESVVTGERYLELKVINPDGTESEEGIPLAAKWLSNLPGLFRKLPDNHYAIYLVQAETDVRRLVIDVFVRNGKLIDPGDDSEGARDRPPTDEASKATTEEKSAVAPNAEQNEAAGGQPVGEEDLPPQSGVNYTAPTTISSAALRHGRALAGVALGLAAANQSWRKEVDKAQAQAEQANWKRLRTAGYWRRRKPK